MLPNNTEALTHDVVSVDNDSGDARGISPSEFNSFDGSFDKEDYLVLTIVMVEMLPRLLAK